MLTLFFKLNLSFFFFFSGFILVLSICFFFVFRFKFLNIVNNKQHQAKYVYMETCNQHVVYIHISKYRPREQTSRMFWLKFTKCKNYITVTVLLLFVMIFRHTIEFPNVQKPPKSWESSILSIETYFCRSLKWLLLLFFNSRKRKKKLDSHAYMHKYSMRCRY